MIDHTIRVYSSSEALAKEDQFAWKIAQAAADAVAIDSDVADMVINRVIDNAAVTAASFNRGPVVHSREQALSHLRPKGATISGEPLDIRVSPEWAAWANGVAVRELDFHDTFLAAEFSHPGDNIPPLLAVAQSTGRTGSDLIRAIVTGYEIQIDLCKGICLHDHRIDHIAHLGVSVVAGLGALLRLPVEVIYQAIGHALHVTTTTRQSRKGVISSWKAFAPAFAGKMGIEAVDRAMRGEESPSPIYEGEDGIVAWMLDGPDANYVVPLPAPGEPKRAILESFTKEYSAEYQAQAFIDLAKRVRTKISDFDSIESITITTSHHTHQVIGTGAGDPQKFDPETSRETLDHSLMFIFAIALEDGGFHHEKSYDPARVRRPETVALWRKISTSEDPEWTRRYHDPNPAKQAFGGSVIITMADGTTIKDSIDVADAHPSGARPFARPQYEEKFRVLAEGQVDPGEQDRWLSLATRLPELSAEELLQLNLVASKLESSDNPGLM